MFQILSLFMCVWISTSFVVAAPNEGRVAYYFQSHKAYAYVKPIEIYSDGRVLFKTLSLGSGPYLIDGHSYWVGHKSGFIYEIADVAWPHISETVCLKGAHAPLQVPGYADIKFKAGQKLKVLKKFDGDLVMVVPTQFFQRMVRPIFKVDHFEECK